METFGNKKTPKNPTIFYCKICNFKCSNKKDWTRHILTAKHKRKLLETDPTITTKPPELTCECGKKYSSKSGLWKHKKVCFYPSTAENYPKNIITAEKEVKEEINEKTEEPDYKEMFFESMKVIKKQSEQLDRIIPVLGNNNITNNNTTNNNTTNNFNLNFFLNETCKDALNLTDFINSIEVQLKDLEYTTDNGHVKGITNIFHNALSNMEENKRPLHCTDLKRETLYIKDNDEWLKDDEKEIIKDKITTVANKNISNTSKWLEKYPDHTNTDSKDFEKYVKMTNNSMGTGDELEQNKIVKNIMKEVTIEKN